MKASELRDKSVDDLSKQLLSLREEQFKLRMAKATGQLSQSHLLKQTKRDIARVKNRAATEGGTVMASTETRARTFRAVL